MIIGKTTIPGLVLAVGLSVVVATLPAAAQQQTSQNTGAAIAALLAIGLGVAIATQDRDDKKDEREIKPFSPSAHVVCLPVPKRCYKDGHLSSKWTRRVFG